MAGVKIAHLTSVHQPFDTRIFRKECRSLAAAGYEVVLVAPHDKDEVVDGVRVRAVPKPRSRAERLSRTVWQVLHAALDEQARLYHFHDPELLPVGLLLKAAGKRVIYDVHENVPEDVLTKAYLPAGARPLIAGGVDAVERMGAARFDRIVTATPAIARRFPAGAAVPVQNFPIPGELVAPGARPYAERPPIAAYVGEMTEIRGLREMVQAMAHLDITRPATLTLAGEFRPPQLEAELRQLPGWASVQSLGWQNRTEVGALLGRARLGLVLFLPGPNHLESQPNKLFEYMSAGLPVVASDFPLWRKIVEGAGCGLLVDPRAPEAIADAIEWLLDHPREAEIMGRRGADAVRGRFNWGCEAATLTRIYHDLLASPTA